MIVNQCSSNVSSNVSLHPPYLSVLLPPPPLQTVSVSGSRHIARSFFALFRSHHPVRLNGATCGPGLISNRSFCGCSIGFGCSRARIPPVALFVYWWSLPTPARKQAMVPKRATSDREARPQPDHNAVPPTQPLVCFPPKSRHGLSKNRAPFSYDSRAFPSPKLSLTFVARPVSRVELMRLPHFLLFVFFCVTVSPSLAPRL